MKLFFDSTNKPIKAGDRVRFRGQDYTISQFIPGDGRWGCAVIKFEEPQHTGEQADECSVDLIEAPREAGVGGLEG